MQTLPAVAVVPFGSLLGALNIYLITYALSTFSFGMVQSFVTDMAYGVMLVLSLLISVALPHIQKHTRNLSPLVFFVILAVIALGCNHAHHSGSIRTSRAGPAGGFRLGDRHIG